MHPKFQIQDALDENTIFFKRFVPQELCFEQHKNETY
jgi:hypothetical protein